MATTTPRIGLTKPDLTDLVDVGVLNTNFDKIDSNIASTKIQSTKPTTANAGDLWWDSDTGTLYVYYTDANSSQWVAATSDPINIGVVANQTERDAQYPTPGQGMRVWRQDLGAQETYFGLYNASTNPGGRDAAGWYVRERTTGLMPVKPSTVTIATGTGSTNAIGTVSFTGATQISLDGIFNANYRNYKIVINADVSTQMDFRIRLRNASGDIVTNDYYSTYMVNSGTAISAGSSGGAINFMMFAINGGGSEIPSTIDLFGPFVPTRTWIWGDSTSGNYYLNSHRGQYGQSTQATGVTIWPTAGNISGSLTVYGWNAS